MDTILGTLPTKIAMQKEPNNLFITFLLYRITLWSNGCIGCISNLFPKNLDHEDAKAILQPLTSGCKELNGAKDPAAPVVLPEHGDDLPTHPVAPTSDYPAPVATPNTAFVTPTSEERARQPDLVSSDSVNNSDSFLKPSLDQVPIVILPDIVSSPTNRNQDSEIAKPGEVVSIETDLIARLVQQVKDSFDKSAQRVSYVALMLEENFNILQNRVIWIKWFIKQLERRVAVTSEELQKVDNDLVNLVQVVGNDITTEELASILANMQSIIQEEKNMMIDYESNLKKKEKREEVVQHIQYITAKAAQAEECVQSTIVALDLVQQRTDRTSSVRIQIKDKAGTALEILKEIKRDSLALLEAASQQKNKIKMLKQSILEAEAKIIQLIESISKEIANAKALEKRFEDIENEYVK